MSRVEDNKRFLELFESSDPLVGIWAALDDISKSLAIIADSCANVDTEGETDGTSSTVE